MGRISVFCAGGTGTNIGARISGFHGEKNDGFAQLDTYFVDTSRSNLSNEIPDERVFLFKSLNGEQLDGNGKVRKANYDILSEGSTIQEILHRFKPGDLNVIISSSGGGTGSVAGPLLAKELISRGENCVVMLVGSTISRVDIMNTLNTLKTYDALSVKLDKPINVLYRENSPALPRQKVDSEIEQYLYLLSAFFSGQNHGLDAADLRNFLNYNHVTSYKPRLTAIDLFRGDIHIPEDSLAISTVTLTAESTEVEHGVLVDYQVTGIAHSKAVEKIKENMPLHGVIFSGFFPMVVNRLQKMLSDHQEKAKRMTSRTIMTNEDHPTDDGIIL